jgi:arylsulfatase A-like enzyme
LYGDVVEEIDAGVGRIMATLTELDLAEKTLVVFTSDNGPWLPFQTHGGSAGLLRQGKGTTYEGGMREPALFWWPGSVQPGLQRELGATMDLLPTFCALAGVEMRDEAVLDGYDLSGLLLGETSSSPRDRVFYWRQERLYAVRVGLWKAHFVTEGCYGLGLKRQQHDPPLLFHLGHDPAEQYNVAERHPEVVTRLKAVAADHQRGIQPVENQLTTR